MPLGEFWFSEFLVLFSVQGSVSKFLAMVIANTLQMSWIEISCFKKKTTHTSGILLELSFKVQRGSGCVVCYFSLCAFRTTFII